MPCGTAISVLLSVVLVAPRSPAGGEPRRIEARGEFVHPTAGVRFPEEVRGFVRTAITQFDDEGRDVAATYELKGSSRRFWATLYVYPVGSGARDLRDKFAGARGAVLEGEGVRLTSEGDFRAGEGLPGRYAAFAIRQPTPGGVVLLHSYLVLFSWRDWWVKWRISFSATDDPEHIQSAMSLIQALTPTGNLLAVEGPGPVEPSVR